MIHAIDTEKIKKILVISLSNIGDVVLTTPVISVLRERFPGAHLEVMVGPKAELILKGSRTIDRLIVFDKRASWMQMARLVFGLWKERFDLVIDLRNTAIPLLIRPRYRTPLRIERAGRQSMRERHLNRIRFLFPIPEQPNRFHFFSEEEKRWAFEKAGLSADGKERDFIVMAPGARSDVKRWTASGFAQTARHFLNLGKTVILVGDKSERDSIEAVEANIGKAVTSLIGTLTLRELAGLISEAILVVTNDSAAMHLANELDRPTISIFGPTDDAKYGRSGDRRRVVRLHLDCTPCEKARCRLPKRICLDDLPAESVIKASEEVLSVHAH